MIAYQGHRLGLQIKVTDQSNRLWSQTWITYQGHSLRSQTSVADQGCRLGLHTADKGCRLGLQTMVADQGCRLGLKTCFLSVQTMQFQCHTSIHNCIAQKNVFGYKILYLSGHGQLTCVLLLIFPPVYATCSLSSLHWHHNDGPVEQKSPDHSSHFSLGGMEPEIRHTCMVTF